MNDIIKNLSAVSAQWLDPSNPLTQETIQALQVSTGLNARQITQAIQNCFEELTEPKINAYVRDWDQVPISNVVKISDKPMSKGQNVLHILPSNAFTAWVHGAVITLLLEKNCFLKASRREPVFARAWKRSLEMVQPTLGARIGLATATQEAYENISAIVAYGADETLRTIQKEIPTGIPFVGYGHKLSVGVIFRECADESSLEDLLPCLRRDADPFRLQGCLSPQILYVENPRMTRWPALDADLDVAPKIRPFERWTDVAAQLEKFNPFLSCIGYAGRSDRQSWLEKECREFEGLRICALGEMQRPPLGWLNGGNDLATVIGYAA